MFKRQGSRSSEKMLVGRTRKESADGKTTLKPVKRALNNGKFPEPLTNSSHENMLTSEKLKKGRSSMQLSSHTGQKQPTEDEQNVGSPSLASNRQAGSMTGGTEAHAGKKGPAAKSGNGDVELKVQDEEQEERYNPFEERQANVSDLNVVNQGPKSHRSNDLSRLSLNELHTSSQRILAKGKPLTASPFGITRKSGNKKKSPATIKAPPLRQVYSQKLQEKND